ncbi:hypothetical protein B7463_g10381, partial [Scytalidium lignicola]
MEENIQQPAGSAAKEQNINPWSVSGEVAEDGSVKPIDYNKLVDQFGTKLIDEALLERFERVTGHKPHRFLRRQIVFSHRDLEVILDRFEKQQPFFLYSGRGPSSDILHIGHIIPFELTKWLSDVFQVPVIIMLTDDEKYLISQPDRTIDEYEAYARENAKDIIAVGLDPERTFIFSDFEYMGGQFYRNITRIAKRVNRGTADAFFGFDSSTNIGKVHFAAIQAASSFAGSFPFMFGPDSNEIPCLIPCAIDQDPYFRLTRDVASQLKYAKPSLIHARFLDALQGPGSKMSASIESSSILVRDNPKTILNKINKYAFSGGRETLEEHREKGGNPDIDVPYQYLKFFLESDEELEQIRQDYKSGKLLTGEIKKKCAEELAKFCTLFQEQRAKVTDQILDHFMTPRPLLCRGVLSNTLLPSMQSKSELSKGSVKDPNSKSQAKKMKKLEAINAKKQLKASGKEADSMATATVVTLSTKEDKAASGDTITSGRSP